jgi:hypothetical protein
VPVALPVRERVVPLCDALVVLCVVVDPRLLVVEVVVPWPVPLPLPVVVWACAWVAAAETTTAAASGTMRFSFMDPSGTR